MGFECLETPDNEIKIKFECRALKDCKSPEYWGISSQQSYIEFKEKYELTNGYELFIETKTCEYCIDSFNADKYYDVVI